MSINLLPPAKKNQRKITPVSHREAFIFFCGLLVLLVGWLFPIQLVSESRFAALILLLAFPVLVILFVLKDPVQNFGLQVGKYKTGLALAAGSFVIFSLLNYFLIFRFNLKEQVLASPGVSPNFWYFLFYELGAATLMVFSWEFFFRGFLQLGLEKKFGIYSLLLGAILSSLIFWKSSWLALGLRFLMYLAAGFTTLKSRSVFYSALAIWLISLALDIMLIKALSG